MSESAFDRNQVIEEEQILLSIQVILLELEEKADEWVEEVRVASRVHVRD